MKTGRTNTSSNRITSRTLWVPAMWNGIPTIDPPIRNEMTATTAAMMLSARMPPTIRTKALMQNSNTRPRT